MSNEVSLKCGHSNHIFHPRCDQLDANSRLKYTVALVALVVASILSLGIVPAVLGAGYGIYQVYKAFSKKSPEQPEIKIAGQATNTVKNAQNPASNEQNTSVPVNSLNPINNEPKSGLAERHIIAGQDQLDHSHGDVARKLDNLFASEQVVNKQEVLDKIPEFTYEEVIIDGKKFVVLLDSKHLYSSDRVEHEEPSSES